MPPRDERWHTDSDEVTMLLQASREGASDARDRLLELVYRDLHAMASARMRGERGDHTLGATALVSEAYLRLFRETGTEPISWADRQGFFATAAAVMRNVLVDHARARTAVKRGGGGTADEPAAGTGGAGTSPGDDASDAPGAVGRTRWERVPLDVLETARVSPPEQILELDDALTRLESVDERAATVVRLRFFAGLELTAIASMLDVSDRTAKRDWAFARAWLHDALGIEGDASADGDGA